MTQEERINYLINYLKNESEEYKNIIVPKNEALRKKLLRAFFNVRPPKKASDEFYEI